MKKLVPIIIGSLFLISIIISLVYVYILNPCIPEGGDWIEGESFFKKRCCSGLVQKSISWPIEEPIEGYDDKCDYFDCLCYTCLKCGNGICDKYENKCNCKEDCS